MEKHALDPAERLANAYALYSDAVRRHCAVRLGDRGKGEEAMQDAFMRTWEYLRSGNRVQNIKTFLYRVASNLVVDEIRRRKRKEEVSLEALQEKGFDPGKEDIAAIQQQIDMWKMLQSFKKRKEYDLLIMRYVNGMQPADIARRTGVAANTIAVRLHRAVKKLEQKWGTGKTAVLKKR